jgi:hypothetical protein
MSDYIEMLIFGFFLTALPVTLAAFTRILQSKEANNESDS